MNPFEVLCIEDKPKYAPPVAEWKIKCGETYTVVNSVMVMHKCRKYIYYELDIQRGIGYPSEFFVRTSDKDEKEIRRNRAVDKWLDEMITVK